MKGTAKLKSKKKAKGSGKSKHTKRAHLHDWNRSYNLQRRARTKLRRVQVGVPGSPQGKHIKSPDCRCGGCNAGYVRT